MAIIFIFIFCCPTAMHLATTCHNKNTFTKEMSSILICQYIVALFTLTINVAIILIVFIGNYHLK